MTSLPSSKSNFAMLFSVVSVAAFTITFDVSTVSNLIPSPALTPPVLPDIAL